MNPSHANTRSVAILVGLFISVNCAAGEWEITPRFRLGGTYSDNIAVRSERKEGDFVTRILPGLSVRGSGGRLDLNLDYNLQNLVYAGDSDRNQTNHQFQGDSNVEILRQRLFVEASGRVSQQIIDNQGRFTDSNINITGNRGDTIAWTIAPYAVHHFGTLADAVLRFEHSEVTNERNEQSSGRGNLQGGSVIDAVSANITSGRSFARFPWSLLLETREVDLDSGSKATFDRAVLTASWRFNRRYSFDATLGLENNEFNSIFSRQDGFYWTLGGTWTPSRRTTAAFGIGDRFFGTTMYARVSHRHRKLLVSLDYNEAPQTQSQQQLLQNFVPVTDFQGNFVLDPELSSDFPLPIDSPSLRNDVFVLKQLNASVSWTGRRDTYSVNMANISRESQANAGEETITRINVRWTHSFSRRLSGGFQGFVLHRDFSNDGTSDRRFNVGPFLRYQIGPTVTGIFDYQYSESSADLRDLDFTENRVNAFLNFAL